jgi:hypothetical protein|tara:strand:+ start:675 stop:932 length:258 start_codon:yes stop_codon:yes gene_type:complete
MKTFFYKTILISICAFLVLQLTFGLQIRQMEGKINELKSKDNIENIKNKLRKEIKSAVEKDNYLDSEDVKLINKLLNKIQLELSK